MTKMFNLVSSLSSRISHGSHGDEHGVAELLEAVSKRSSCVTEEERREIEEMAHRVRTYRHGDAAAAAASKSPKTPPSAMMMTPDNSQHDDKKKSSFGKDLLQVDLLRGFGPVTPPPPMPKDDMDEDNYQMVSPTSVTSTPGNPNNDINSPPLLPVHLPQRDSGIMLRDFGPPPSSSIVEDDHTDETCEKEQVMVETPVDEVRKL